jgi:hypothetical protein
LIKAKRQGLYAIQNKQGVKTMCTNLFQDSRLFLFIQEIDQDAAALASTSRCPACGGKLDRAYYQRKPRSVPDAFEEDFSRRPSFCCRQDGCRKRSTPVQLKFLSRKVYVSVVVLLVAAMTQGLSPARLCDITRLTKIPPRTIKRWLTFWQKVFTASRAWVYQRGNLLPPIDEQLLPLGLLERFLDSCAACFPAICSILRLAIP